MVYIPLEERKLGLSINIDHWPIWIRNEIEWFQFDGILVHIDFHAKGDNILSYSLLKLFYMFSIRIWKAGGCNTKVICIKFNNCDITVTYHLTSEE